MQKILLLVAVTTLGCGARLRASERENAELQNQLASERAAKDAEAKRAQAANEKAAKAEAVARDQSMKVEKMCQVALTREQQFDKVSKALEPAGSAGQVAIKHRERILSIGLSDEVFFAPGKAELQPEGKKVLQRLAGALHEMPDRPVQVIGKGDLARVKGAKYKNTWALSQQRALAVQNYLMENGVQPWSLATGSIVQSTAEEPSQHIEIILQPTQKELVPQLRAFRQTTG